MIRQLSCARYSSVVGMLGMLVLALASCAGSNYATLQAASSLSTGKFGQSVPPSNTSQAASSLSPGETGQSVPPSELSQPTPLIVDVELTDVGFQPSPLSLPRGVRIMLTVRNHGLQQHHFHIIGLTPDDMLWFERADQGQADGAQSATGMDGTSDVHQEHHPGGSYVGYHICTTGLCDLAGGVHLHADPGDADTVLFTANQVGAFEVTDPLHPELIRSVIVH